MTVYLTNPEELHGIQADVLWESVASNPKLPRKTSSALNRQLDTGSTRVIGAVNEIKLQADAAVLSVENALNHMNNLVGDITDPEISEKLAALGTNVIAALDKLNTELNGALDESKAYTDEKFKEIGEIDLNLIDGGEF